MNYLNTEELNKLDISFDESAGDFIYCQRQYTLNGYFDFTGKEKITSTTDVAFILKGLLSYGVEHSFACFVLEDNSAIVQHLGMGDFSSCIINVDMIRYTSEKLNAKEIYMAHNHPSGNLTFSKADRIQHTFCMDSLENKYKGSIIINTITGKFAFIKTPSEKENIEVIPQNTIWDIPIQVLEFDKQVFSKDYSYDKGIIITSPGDVAAFISSQKFGDRDKAGLIVINRAMHITANIQLPYSRITPSKYKEMASYIQKCIAATGGTGAILYFTDDISKNMVRALNNEFNKISKFELQDICYTYNSKFKSAAMDGLLRDNLDITISQAKKFKL